MRYSEIINEEIQSDPYRSYKPKDKEYHRYARDMKEIGGLRYVYYEVPLFREIGFECMVFVFDDQAEKRIGLASIDGDGGSWQVWVDDAYQRKGIASKMYDWVAEKLGKKIYPASKSQTNDGQAFWAKRKMTETDNGFHALTDTPEFKKWFHGSKIVDQNGEPLVVWHGLKNPISHIDGLNKRVLFSPHFSEFDVTKTIEPGAWFSPQQNFAKHYGTPAPFFLRILNPIQEESPITEPPIGHDGVYRMRSSRTDIWDALEIAVFDPSQIRLAFDINQLG